MRRARKERYRFKVSSCSLGSSDGACSRDINECNWRTEDFRNERGGLEKKDTGFRGVPVL